MSKIKLKAVIVISFIMIVVTGWIFFPDRYENIKHRPTELKVNEKYLVSDGFILVLTKPDTEKLFSKFVTADVFYRAEVGKSLILNLSKEDVGETIGFGEPIATIVFIFFVISLMIFVFSIGWLNDPYLWSD